MTATEPFIFEGKTVDDSILYPWAVQAISRALRFNAEACNQLATQPRNGYVLATIAMYYSMFHLGVFLACSVPYLLDVKVRKKINECLKAGKDPSRALFHKEVGNYLDNCQSQGLPNTVIRVFKRSKELRDFVNYGPDLKHTSKNEFRVFNRDYHPNEYPEIVKKIESAFVEVVDWACRNAIHGGIIVPAAIQSAASFFTPNHDGESYYTQWSSEKVLEDAERLRAALAKKASERVYPNKRA